MLSREKEASGRWEDKSSSLEASRRELGAKRLFKMHVEKLRNSKDKKNGKQKESADLHEVGLEKVFIDTIEYDRKLFMVNDTS